MVGCNHGPVCSWGACKHCSLTTCPLEQVNTDCTWTEPSNKERVGKKMGKEWLTIEHKDTRQDYMNTMKIKLEKFAEHDKHVTWSKKQMRKLKRHLPADGIILKCDFIENLAHIRAAETSQSWFGRRQTQMLTAVVWFWGISKKTGQKKVSISCRCCFIYMVKNK